VIGITLSLPGFVMLVVVAGLIGGVAVLLARLRRGK